MDSSDAQSQKPRYSYIGLFPQKILRGENPWPVMRDWKSVPRTGEYSLMSGWVGYLSYESAAYLGYDETLFYPPSVLPKYWFTRHSDILVLDHQMGRAYLTSHESTADELEKKKNAWDDKFTQALKRGFTQASPPDSTLASLHSPISKNKMEHSEIQSPWSFEEYADLFDQAKKYFEKGDAYQINLTGRFCAKSPMSAAEIYSTLRQFSPAPYAAFFNGGDFQICSASPECFLKGDDHQIQTQPIKGTRCRSQDKDDDLLLQKDLESSQKEAAELLMIVDLERNDLGKVCEYGSVQVEELGQTTSFTHWHHRMATITGSLKKGLSSLSALEALFPGGSITGAPKKRAMEIIRQLERSPREIYTGALGYWDDSGQTMWNIPIRTLYKKGSSVYWHAGGGLVFDSKVSEEYAEVFLKTKGIRQALGL